MNKKIYKKSAKTAKSRVRKAPKKNRTIAPKKKGYGAVLARSGSNPIIAPRKENHWEAWQTFNPGVVLLDGTVHFLYRAIGEDGISRFGYAASRDGFVIHDRMPHPAYEHQIAHTAFNTFSYFSGGSWGGAEDPRPVRVDDEGLIYVTYTACDDGLRIALVSIAVSDFLHKRWNWSRPVLISPPGELHKNWLIFPEKINGKYALLHSIVPKVEVAYCDRLDFDGTNFIDSQRGFGPLQNNGKKGCWDKWIRGAGAPPIKTKDGWLVFYHAMDDDWSKYKVGALLLDLHDPSKILYRAREPILEPEADYELNGFKGGVVYVSGAIVKNGELLVYYGAADSYIGVAHANLKEFLEAMKKNGSPKLKIKSVKKK